MPLREFAGGAPATRLAGSLASGTTTNFAVITAGGNGYPTGATAPFVVVIDRGTALEEKILVTTRSSDTFSGLTRGYDGTSAQAHSAQAVVEHVIDAAVMTEANAHVNTVSRDDHTQYIKTDGTRAFTAVTAIANVTPGASAVADTASIGSNLTLARSDHRHAREAAHRVGHTFAVSGEVAVASGDLDFLNGIFVPVAPGRTVKLVAARYKINSGTNAVVKLQINGVDVTGFTSMTVTTTATTTDPVDISMADGDRLNLVVISASGTPRNLSFTVYLEHG